MPYYRVSKKDDPDFSKVLYMDPVHFPGKITPMTVKDYACSKGLYPWDDYAKLKVKKLDNKLATRAKFHPDTFR